jgi:hypothetical protein
MLETPPVQMPPLSRGSQPEVGLSGPADGAAAPSFSMELDALRADLKRLLDQQQELMQLLGTKRPEKLVHDVRNLLQERMFLEAACKRFGG